MIFDFCHSTLAVFHSSHQTLVCETILYVKIFTIKKTSTLNIFFVNEYDGASGMLKLQHIKNLMTTIKIILQVRWLIAL